MKNKEIEELLNNLKSVYELNKPLTDKYKEDSMRFVINTKEAELLLSYIEQLKNRNKELYEGFMATQEELTDYATRNEKLENNRDKALKKLNKYRNRKDHFGLWCMDYGDNADIIDILKGDSDD